MTNWTEIIAPYKKELLADLDGLLRIASVKDLKTASDKAPFGKNIDDALTYMLSLGQRDGFTVKNLDHYAGHIEIGQGEKSLGILTHLDVVPADASQWETDPFEPTYKDGKLYARGSLDDKGPALMAYYAVKILKDLGYTFNQRIRLIYGTDEENDWQGVEHYFKQEAMPDFGIVPDGIFPMIYAEKGIASIQLSQAYHSQQLLSFDSGSAYNVVPDYAKAVLDLRKDVTTAFNHYLSHFDLEGKIVQDGSRQVLEVFGKSAHAAGPERGVNAALHLVDFLSHLNLRQEEQKILSFIRQNFFGDSSAKTIGLAYHDQILGDVTNNLALIKLSGGEIRIGFNLRYPATYDYQSHLSTFKKLAQSQGFALEEISHRKPSYADLESPETKLLLDVYRKHTGDQTPPLAIGGLTYGRIFERGITFGPSFLGSPATLHQPNESIELNDLFKSLEIYIDAIYRLATVEGHD